MGLLLFGLFLAITLAVSLTPGVGLLALTPFALAVAVGIWLVLALLGRSSPSQAGRSTHRPRLLGAGGPDDSERSR
jgi:hypothetical protein